MPKKSTSKGHDDEDIMDPEMDDLEEEEEPLPIKRDTSIFNIKKEKDDKDDDFDEDVFV